MSGDAEFYGIVGPDVDGYLPTAQYIDLRGQRYLRSADLKWLLWRPDSSFSPGHWELVYTVVESGSPMFGTSLTWLANGRPINVNEPVLPVRLADDEIRPTPQRIISESGEQPT